MDNNTNKKPNKVNMTKFNLNWLYTIIAMMLLGLYLTNESGTATKNISYDEFQQYVRAVSYTHLTSPVRQGN